MHQGEHSRLRLAPSCVQGDHATGAQRVAPSVDSVGPPLHARRGRLTLLHVDDAPPVLGYALACSVAWHTRRPTIVLVAADGDLPRDLLTLASVTAGRAARMTAARAHLMTVPSGDDGNAGMLAALLDDLRGHYDDVLVEIGRGCTMPVPGARHVHLVGHQPAGHAAAAGGALTLHGWATGACDARPDHAGVLQVPLLRPDDEHALRGGLLPSRTPAGRALGRAARDIAHLKVGLALGCGATKGYAHIGVWRVLDRAGLTADVVAGTSIGAAVAALYALGSDPDRAAAVLDMVGDAAWRVALPTTALLSNAGLHDRLRRVSGERRIEELDRPLAVVAADITTWQEVVFRRGLVRTAVLASMAVPGIYPPVCMGRHTLVDGSVLNPVPGDVAAAMGANVVIAVTLAGRSTPTAVAAEAVEVSSRAPSMLPVIMQSIALMQGKITTPITGATLIQIAPALTGMADPGLRHFRRGHCYIAPGERAAEAALPRLAAALPWLRDVVASP